MEPSAAVDVLDAVVCAALAAADAAEPGWQPRADFLVYAVLAVMPWAGRTLALGEGEGTFERLMQSVEEYLGKRRQGPDPAAMIFASDATDDWLEEIWGRVNEVRKAGHQNAESWTVRSVPPVTMAFEEELREAGGISTCPRPSRCLTCHTTDPRRRSRRSPCDLDSGTSSVCLDARSVFFQNLAGSGHVEVAVTITHFLYNLVNPLTVG